MINLTPEERETGRGNYYSAVTAHDMNRRDFLARSVAAGVAAGGLGAIYYGYQKPVEPVRTLVIGTGDEGSVLMGAINPEYVQVTAVCDIRPSSIHRAFEGDWTSDNTIRVRPGLKSVYGWSDEEAKKVKRYTDWQEAIKDKNVDAVIIATPLFLHAPMAIAAMQAGKHVLCEKLMGHNVAQCKLMARVAEEQNSFFSVGHQRHYSILYDNAVNLIRWGLLGEIHHIRAQWHRNNSPGNDSWALPIPGGEQMANGQTYDKIADQLKKLKRALADRSRSVASRRKLAAQVAQWEAWDQDKTVDAEKHGYISRSDVYPDGRVRSALEEMVRWRLWDRTGGGLMAELGSHQLDAASIFISALSKEKDKHVHPLTVHAMGGRHIFPNDRDADDHVYCSFEFPGQGYDYDFDVGYYDKVNQYPDPQAGVPSFKQDNEKKVVVTYSSINGNGFGGYGEIVMGTKATLMIDREKEVLLWPTAGTSYKAGVKQKDGVAVLDTSASGDAGPAKTVEGSGPVSRGYREQIEHWAWCISTGDQANQPRCNGPVALADAVIALTAKQAIAQSKQKGKNGFIAFQPEWFEMSSDAVPEANGSAEETKKIFATEKKDLGLA